MSFLKWLVSVEPAGPYENGNGLRMLVILTFFIIFHLFVEVVKG